MSQNAAAAPTMDEAPQPPIWLTEPYAVKLWEHYCSILIEQGVLMKASLGALAILCDTEAQICKLKLESMQIPARVANTYAKYLHEFGFTPQTVGKVTPGGKKGPDNKFGRFGKRPT